MTMVKPSGDYRQFCSIDESQHRHTRLSWVPVDGTNTFMHMKVKLILVLLFISAASFAQSKLFAGYIRLGMVQIPDSKNILGEMTSYVYPFAKSYYGIGGELSFESRQWVINSELMVHSHGAVNANEKFAEPFLTNLLLKTGYVLVQGKNAFIYPAVGGGFSGLILSTYKKTDGVKVNMHSAYLAQPCLDFSVNSDVIIYRFSDQPSTGILPVGLRVGYRLTGKSDNWKRMEGTEIKNLKFSASGWYLSVALGMGYVKGKKE